MAKNYNLLFEVTPLNGTTPITLRLTTLSGDKFATTANSQIWLPCITSMPDFGMTLSADGLLDEVQIERGEISFFCSDDFTNHVWSSYVWNNAFYRAWYGENGTDFSSYSLLGEGRTTNLERDGNQVTVRLLGPEADVTSKLLSNSYLGIGGAEGPLGFKGNLKPRCFGSPLSVEPIELDPVNLVYQVHGYGAVGSIKPYEYGLPLEADQFKGNAASYADLIALPLVPGEYATCLAEGMFRFGGTPTPKITADVTMPGGTSLADVATAILTASDVPVTKIGNLAAVSAVETNLFITSQVEALEALQSLFQQAGCYLFADKDGVWQCGKFYASTKSVTTLNSDRSTFPILLDWKEEPTKPPIKKVSYGFQRCWGVHSDSEASPIINELAQKAEENAYWENIKGEGKPDDNATVGAPSGTPVGDKTADEVVDAITDEDGNVISSKQLQDDIDEANQGIADLVDTYGSTATAAASANAAQIAANTATAASNNAQTASDNAATAKADAEKAQNDAVAAKNAAESAKTAALTAATNAGTANTAAQSAKTAAENAKTAAQTAKTDAETAFANSTTAKTAAETAKTAAETARNNAQTYATNANNSATAAAGSASTASTKATEAGNSATAAAASDVSAASSFSDARLTTASLLPSDFSQNGRYWTNSIVGSPAAVTNLETNPNSRWTFVDVSGVGRVAQVVGASGNSYISQVGATKSLAGRTYRITAVARTLADSTTGFGLFLEYMDASYAQTGTSFSPNQASTVAGEWYTVSRTVAGDSLIANGHIYFRAAVRNTGSSTPSTVQVSSLRVEDITESLAAEASANAASTSASSAATSATNAGQSASAAQSSATTASTKAGEASTSASNASTSATNAKGSENAAKTSQTAAATSATNAGNSATAASNSASTASTKATEASQSASSATEQANTATTKAGQASTSASQAATSASDALGSKNAAASSASTAANSATNAANSASAASNSASTASTKATEAGNSAASAASSAVSANSTYDAMIQSQAASPILPYDFSDGLNQWTGSRYGLPQNVTNYDAATVINGDGVFGRCVDVAWTGAGQNLMTRGVVPATAGRVYEVTARFRVRQGDGEYSFNIASAWMDGSGAEISWAAHQTTTVTGSDTVELTALFGTSSQGGYLWPSSAVYGRFGLRNNSSESGMSVRIASIRVTDVTEKLAAANSASAASTSASNAATSATNAGTSASAAQASATTATTKAGQASTSASNAATSETNANASKNAAATSATNAANSANAAGGSASAASGSASNASTQATNAGNSANAAAASAITAQSSAENATYLDVYAAYDFSNKATNSFAASNSAISGQDTGLFYTETGSDPQLYRTGLSFAGGRYTRVIVDLTRTSNRATGYWDGTMFWSTSGHSWNGNYRVLESTGVDPVLNQRTQLTFDLVKAIGASDWMDNTITGVRFDLDSSNGGAFTIHSIRIVGPDSLAPANSAAAAATSASAAGTSATNAGISANSASNSANTATTKANEAAGSASSAATSASNASSSSNSAGNSATAANNSEVSASLSAASLMPSDFQQDGKFWQNGFGGLPSSLTPITANSVFSFVNVAGEGRVLRVASASQVDVGNIGMLPLQANRIYRLTARVRQIAGSVFTSLQLYRIGVTAGGGTTSNGTVATTTFSALNEWREISGVVEAGTTNAMISNGVANIRTLLRLTPSSSSVTVEYSFIRIEDITESANAAGSASAAATSASSAAASQSAAGSSASSAQTSATNAATSAGQASTSASNASTSANNAAGSANTASTQANNAANSANAAAGSASAASGSASTASTKANEAGNSASAANSSQLAASSSAAATLPSDFTNGGEFFRANDYRSRPSTGSSITADSTFSFPTISGEGTVMQVVRTSSTGSIHISPRGWVKLVAGRSYNVRARVRSTTANATCSVFSVSMDQNSEQVGTFSTSKPGMAANTWYDLEVPFAGSSHINVGGVYVRPLIRLDTNSTFQIALLAIDDITESTAAAGSASAAATSASNASTSATNAGNSASSASGSANTAATQAGNASNSASAAAGSASSAATSSSNAGSSATSASNSANTASTKAGEASSSASAASGSAATASAAASTATTQANLTAQYSTGGGNLLNNTDVAVDTSGWNFNYVSQSAAGGRNMAGDSWRISNENNLGIQQPNNTSSGYAEWNQTVSVEAGNWYDVSALVAAHRCQVVVYIQWLNSSNSAISAPNSGSLTPGNGGNTISGWTQVGFKAQAPSNAVQARLILRKLPTTSGQSDSYAWFSRPQVRQTFASAPTPCSYSVGSAGAVAATQQASINSNQTAIATANSSIANLTNSVSTLNSSVTTQQVAINNLNGKTAAYWQVNAVSGGRAQLTVYADSNGGGGVDIVGDLRVTGNALISGTVNPEALALGRFVKRLGPTSISATSNTGTLYSATLGETMANGSYLLEGTVGFTYTAGRSTTTYNGKPYYIDYVNDGGIRVQIKKNGNIIASTGWSGTLPSNYGSQTYGSGMTTNFDAPDADTYTGNVTIEVVAFKGTTDTGIINDGDFYRRTVSGNYTNFNFSNLKLKWTFI